MATDEENTTIRLLRARAAALESSLRAYDAFLNTGLADALRKRNAELERVLWGVAHGGHLPQAERKQLEIILGNKVTPKY